MRSFFGCSKNSSGGASSTITPSSINKIRSATSLTRIDSMDTGTYYLCNICTCIQCYHTISPVTSNYRRFILSSLLFRLPFTFLQALFSSEFPALIKQKEPPYSSPFCVIEKNGANYLMSLPRCNLWRNYNKQIPACKSINPTIFLYGFYILCTFRKSVVFPLFRSSTISL